MPVIPTTLAEISGISNDNKGILPLPLSNFPFTFDSFGLAGFFGGGRSVVGMAVLKFVPGHRWWGWYNSPGSCEMARQYGPLSRLPLLDALFPDGESDPTKLFKVAGRKGPQFFAADSGETIPTTGHFADLIMKKAREIRPDSEIPRENGTRTGKETPHTVTIIELPPVGRRFDHHRLPPVPRAWLFILPVLVSISACVVCALVADWFGFTSIAVGIVVNGLTHYVVGSGKLTLRSQELASSPSSYVRGDGVLKEDNDLVILLGRKDEVDIITGGFFGIQYGAPKFDDLDAEASTVELSNHVGDYTRVNRLSILEPERGNDPPPCVRARQPRLKTWYHNVPLGRHILRTYQWCQSPPQYLLGFCAILLILQFLAQLLLVPLSTLFGQLMFIVTIISSWLYHILLCSINREALQTRTLFSYLHLHNCNIRKYPLPTSTAAVALSCMVLTSMHRLDNVLQFLDRIIPNNTTPWKEWKRIMVKECTKGRDEMWYFKGGEEVMKGIVDGAHLQGLNRLLHDTRPACEIFNSLRDFRLFENTGVA